MAAEMTDYKPLKTAIRLIVHCVAQCLSPYSMFWTVWDRESHSALFNFPHNWLCSYSKKSVAR